MKSKGGHFAIGVPLADFKEGHGAPVPPPRSATYAQVPHLHLNPS